MGYETASYYRLFNEPRIDYEELSRCFFRETLEYIPETDPYMAKLGQQ